MNGVQLNTSKWLPPPKGLPHIAIHCARDYTPRVPRYFIWYSEILKIYSKYTLQLIHLISIP